MKPGGALAPILGEREARGEAGRVQAGQIREDEREVEAFRNGEQAAFDRLVLKYQRRIYRLCLRCTGSHADADDLAQEVFLHAYRGLGRFRSAARFSTWLYRIAWNACMNWTSSKKTAEALPDDLVDAGPSALDRLSREQAAARLRQAVERLPERQRAVLLLRVYEGLSHREIAEILGSPVGTVKANLFHALANLRKLAGGARPRQEGWGASRTRETEAREGER